jgi:hypothetical protein
MISVPSTAEQERPAEWLDALKDEGYGRLLADAGNIAVAAHRLARALCRTRELPSALPTLRELEAAARLLAEACDVALPSSRVLAQACELAGLDVIEPLERTPTPARAAEYRVDVDVRAYAY